MMTTPNVAPTPIAALLPVERPLDGGVINDVAIVEELGVTGVDVGDAGTVIIELLEVFWVGVKVAEDVEDIEVVEDVEDES